MQWWFGFPVAAGGLAVRTVLAAGATVGQTGGVSYDVAGAADEERYGGWWQTFAGDIIFINSARLPDTGSTSGYRYVVEGRTLTASVGLSSPFTLVDDAPWAFVWGGATAVGDELHGYFVAPHGDRERLFRNRFQRGVGILAAAEPLFDDGWFGTVSCTGSLLAYNRLDWDIGFGGDRVRLFWVGDHAWLAADRAPCVDDGQCAGGRCRQAACCDGCSLWKGP